MDDLLLAEVYILNSDLEKAGTLLAEVETDIQLPYTKAELLAVKGKLSQAENDLETARKQFEEALDLNPYHLQARVDLIRLLRSIDEQAEATKLIEEAERLEIPLGPDFSQALN